MEEKLLALDVPIPVYFAIETPELSDIYDKVIDGGDSESAAAGEMTMMMMMMMCDHVN